jgi:hypothetical protein
MGLAGPLLAVTLLKDELHGVPLSRVDFLLIFLVKQHLWAVFKTKEGQGQID